MNFNNFFFVKSFVVVAAAAVAIFQQLFYIYGFTCA